MLFWSLACLLLMQVVGVDYSGRLIDMAQCLQKEGTTVVTDCGKEVSLQQFPGVHPDRAVFKQVSITCC